MAVKHQQQLGNTSNDTKTYRELPWYARLNEYEPLFPAVDVLRRWILLSDISTSQSSEPRSHSFLPGGKGVPRDILTTKRFALHRKDSAYRRTGDNNNE